MKLSKIILENNKYVVREQLDLSDYDIERLTETITTKLEDYLDIDNRDLLLKSVKGAIKELIQ